MDQKFFAVPFANSGDKVAVPNALDPSGSVSYTSGWGFDYQRTLGTDPQAKPVPRQATNQLAYDVTSALGALQRKAFPEWVGPADNDGSALAYPEGAVVMYFNGVKFVPYVSIVDGNNVEPGTDAAKWQLFLFEESTALQATTGTDDTTVMTPRRVAAAIAALGGTPPAASTTVSGITRYATLAEANAQTVTNAAVTPSALTGYVRNSGSAQQISTTFEFRLSANRIRLFDNNNDVAALTLYTGVGTASDRHAGILNQNAGGNIYIQAGNNNSQFVCGPSSWAFVTGGVTHEINNSNTVFRSTILTVSPAGLGYVQLSGGSASLPGYLAFLTPDNVRRGYIGWGNASRITLTGENGWSWWVSNDFSVGGISWATGGFQIGSSKHIKDIEAPITGARAVVRSIVPQLGRYKSTYCADDSLRAFLIAEDLLDSGASTMVRENAIDEFQFVEEGEDRGRKLPSVDYDQGVPYLWAALREEMDRNDELEARIARLEALLTAKE